MIDRFYRNFFIVLTTIGTMIVLYKVRTLLTPVFSALLFAYILYPVINAASKVGISKGTTITFIFVVLFASVSYTGITLVPRVRDLALKLYAENVGALPAETPPARVHPPEILPPPTEDPDEPEQDTLSALDPAAPAALPMRPRWQERLEASGVLAPVMRMANRFLRPADRMTEAQMVARVAEIARDMFTPAFGGWETVLERVGLAAKSTFQFLMIFAFVLVFALLDGDKIYKGIIQLIPNTFFEPGVLILKKTSDMLGYYLRGLLIENLILLVVSFVLLLPVSLLTQLTIPMAVIIAVIIALTNVIRIVGPFIGAGMALLLILLTSTDFMAMLAVVVVAVVIQVIDNVAVLPLVMQEQVDVHPVFCIVGVLMGGMLAGVLGMVVAIPAIGAIKVVYSILSQEMKKFNMDPEPSSEYVLVNEAALH
jgi:predicted PurR-regulated permease PerM